MFGNRDFREDERRLFATYEKSSDEVKITPGYTFRQPGKTALQAFSKLKPVNTLSLYSRESGPVRAQRKTRLSTNDQVLATSTFPHRLPSATDLDKDERPSKRPRRDSSPTFSRAISLVDDDEPAHQVSTLAVNARRLSRLSSASSQHSSQKKPRDALNGVGEYREVEKMMSKSNSCRKNDQQVISEEAQNELVNDNRDESFTQAATKQRRSQASLVNVDNLDSATHPMDNLHLEARPAHEVLETVHTPRRRFLKGNGRRRPYGIRESPDELQGDATVPPAPAFVNSNNRRTLNLKYQPIDGNEGDSWPDAQPSSPNDIQPTVFISRYGKDVIGHKNRRTVEKKSHLRLFDASLFRFGSFERSASPGSVAQVVINLGNRSIGLAEVDRPQPAAEGTIPLRRINRVQQGEGQSRKIRLGLAKTEGMLDDKVDIELTSEKDKVDMCSLLAKQGAKIQEKDSDWMDRAFEYCRKLAGRQKTACKRPSIEDRIPVPEIKVGAIKRQRISQSLQGGNYNQALRRNDSSDRPLKSYSSDKLSFVHLDDNTHSNSAIHGSVKNCSTTASEVRQTRSMSRRALVSISDGGVPTPKSKHDSPSFDWSRPLVYPREGKRKAEVDGHDLERLRDGEFLNDNLIGFYLRFLEHHLERTQPELSRRIYFFNSYFFATLTNTPKGKRGINYEGVQKWTRNVDIFSHDYVVVPINENAHWYVAIICNLPSLQRTLDMTPESEANEKHARGKSSVREKSEIPETPSDITNGECVEELEISGNWIEEAGEEKTCQSFASMTLSDKEFVDGSHMVDKPQDVSNEFDDHWPEKEENQTPLPPKFANPGGRHLPPKNRSREEQAEQLTRAVNSSRAERALRRQSRLPLGKDDPKEAAKDDTKQPTIITFDSLDLPRSPTIRVLREYLREEGISKREIHVNPKDIKGMTARQIPLQSNFSDCGLYLLAYLEKFVQGPDEFIGKLLRREMKAHTDWPPLKSGLLRDRLRSFLINLYDEQKVGDDSKITDWKPVSVLLAHQSVRPPDNTDAFSGQSELSVAATEGNLSLGRTSATTPYETVDGEEKLVYQKGRKDSCTVLNNHSKDKETEQVPTGSLVKHAKDSQSISNQAKTERIPRNNANANQENRDVMESAKERETAPQMFSQLLSETRAENGQETPQFNDNLIEELYEITLPQRNAAGGVQVPGTPPPLTPPRQAQAGPRSSPGHSKQQSRVK